MSLEKFFPCQLNNLSSLLPHLKSSSSFTVRSPSQVLSLFMLIPLIAIQTFSITNILIALSDTFWDRMSRVHDVSRQKNAFVTNTTHGNPFVELIIDRC